MGEIIANSDVDKARNGKLIVKGISDSLIEVFGSSGANKLLAAIIATVDNIDDIKCALDGVSHGK